jgi:hypothetical protein
MKKHYIFLLIFICIFIFFMVYIPHFTNSLPIHIDEWHHIEEAMKLDNGIISGGHNSRELGFHLILAFFGLFFNLIKIYQFLPALFAVISSLTLFFIVKHITKDNKKSFFIAIFSMIFFAGVKSNVNILGLWFFTPLTFSIPLIYLYMYFFKEGLDNENKRYIIWSLIIMIFLIFIHALSLLFSIPILMIYSIINYKKIKNNFRIFSLFLLIPIIGLVFYFLIMRNNFSFLYLLNELLFKKGWGVIEMNNSPLELYSIVGYMLAIISTIIIFYKRERKYYFYVIWPLTLFFSIMIYRIFGFSLFSPYQRNLYYIAISLPFLSSLGLNYCLELINKINFNFKTSYNKIIKSIFKWFFILVIIFLTFNSYFNISTETKLYRLIDENDIKTLMFLETLPFGNVLAPLEISNTVYPISKKQPVAVINFYGYTQLINDFFKDDNCTIKENIINWTNSSYVLSKFQINCNYTLIYQDGDYLYVTK